MCWVCTNKENNTMIQKKLVFIFSTISIICWLGTICFNCAAYILTPVHFNFSLIQYTHKFTINQPLILCSMNTTFIIYVLLIVLYSNNLYMLIFKKRELNQHLTTLLTLPSICVLFIMLSILQIGWLSIELYGWLGYIPILPLLLMLFILFWCFKKQLTQFKEYKKLKISAKQLTKHILKIHCLVFNSFSIYGSWILLMLILNIGHSLHQRYQWTIDEITLFFVVMILIKSIVFLVIDFIFLRKYYKHIIAPYIMYIYLAIAQCISYHKKHNVALTCSLILFLLFAIVFLFKTVYIVKAIIKWFQTTQYSLFGKHKFSLVEN